MINAMYRFYKKKGGMKPVRVFSHIKHHIKQDKRLFVWVNYLKMKVIERMSMVVLFC